MKGRGEKRMKERRKWELGERGNPGGGPGGGEVE